MDPNKLSITNLIKVLFYLGRKLYCIEQLPLQILNSHLKPLLYTKRLLVWIWKMTAQIWITIDNNNEMSSNHVWHHHGDAHVSCTRCTRVAHVSRTCRARVTHNYAWFSILLICHLSFSCLCTCHARVTHVSCTCQTHVTHLYWFLHIMNFFLTLHVINTGTIILRSSKAQFVKL